MYEMLSRNVLFPGKSGADQLQKILAVSGYYPDCLWLNNTNGLNKYGKASKISAHGAAKARQIIENMSAQLYQHEPNGYNHRATANGQACYSRRMEIALTLLFSHN